MIKILLILLVFLFFLILCFLVIIKTQFVISEIKNNKFKKTLNGKFLYFTSNNEDFEQINSEISQRYCKEIIHIEISGNKIKSIYDTDKIHRLINKEELKHFPLFAKISSEKLSYLSLRSLIKTVKNKSGDINEIYFFIDEWFEK